MRLPAHMEVVDAELAGMLMVLKEMAAREDAATVKSLIMSDCASTMEIRRRSEYSVLV